MIEALHTPCRRCGEPCPPSRGQARVYCGAACRRVTETDLRALRHELEDAQQSVAHYSQFAAHPIPGLATPAHARREVTRHRARVVELERALEALKTPPLGTKERRG